MSLADLEKFGNSRVKAGKGGRGLPTSTVSDALSGKRRIKKDLLEALLAAWRVQPHEYAQIMQKWQRLNATLGQGPANAGRVDEATPRELGIHPAISIAGEADQLPHYVPRDFDDHLREAIAKGAAENTERGCFVVLIGRSSCGKTRSLYEAVNDLIPTWWLVQPTRTQEVQDLLGMPAEKTVLWLDELQRFLGAEPPLRKVDIVTLVKAGMIVVGTLWPDHYWSRKRLGHGDEVHTEDRQLLEFAEVIGVPEELTLAERKQAGKLASTDSRIRVALAASDAGLTQVLAAGPDLVNVWDQAPDPYSKAMLSAAADARRLGVQSALPLETLIAAMEGYLSRPHRGQGPGSWLDRALLHATNKLHGEVSALTKVVDERIGNVGYVVADYLTEHISRVRRAVCPPDSLWEVLTVEIRDPDDLRRLAGAALARMRYHYAEPVLREMHRKGDHMAAVELVTLLRRQDRLVEAMAVVDTWSAANPGDKRRGDLRAELMSVQFEAEQLRRQDATELLAELLADGGQANAARSRAATGSAAAEEELAEMLADRGCVDELRELAENADRYAAERFADLLWSLGRTDELQRRAEAGDAAARRHLHGRAQRDRGGRSSDIARLRAEADSGNDEAAVELTLLLFEAGDRDGLLAEVNAGTRQAVERYLALLTADPDTDRHHIRDVRAHGLSANGRPYIEDIAMTTSNRAFRSRTASTAYDSMKGTRG